MNLNFRTMLRVFLVVGGGAFFVLGLRNGDTLQLALGLLAVLLGGGGLVHEWQTSATKD